MAAPAHDPSFGSLEPSFDLLGKLDQPWTAQMAIDLLPENNGPKVEVFRGSVIVTPHAGYDHQAAERQLSFLLHKAARAARMWAYPEVNVVSGDDLFIPDFAVLRRSGRGHVTMPISEVVLIGEIVSTGSRRKDVIDRPREYAAGGVPFYLRVEFRNQVPSLVLHRLIDGDYRPIVAAAAGTTFTMSDPFAFAIDPADLMDSEDDED
ncbi:Uma2 family endonuclease [Actinoplanes sp. LDG1-06]|uniref:Uma2 family endonuclease n=1 Tax=Paractinoplanes ovalisporus TaxID=2810368 RepID=A0ABS2ACT3_9ACTN|nr:Uma2 family endonuclease [Actinoplanes ovalisporus]MBM2617636.1 Uma2 family endonuclease [Actinoplanes ovalisporus]